MQFKTPFLLVLFCVVFATSSAQKYSSLSTSEIKTEWNGATFSSTKTLAENLKDLNGFSFLNMFLKDESLNNALASEEMVTIFVPSDEAFMKLSETKRDSLLANKDKIASTIKFLTIPGRLDLASIKTILRQNDRVMYLATLSGEKLGVKLLGEEIILFDSENNTAVLSATNFYHKNGLFHFVSGLVFPSTVK